jgi:transketolase
MTLRKLDSPLQGHPDMTKLPGIEASTGSEGQGLSIGIGMAIAGKLDRKNYRVYVLLGDGEMDCGQIWEAAMAATHLKVKGEKLDNLIAIVDRNKLQLDSFTKEIMDIEPLADKWKSFGWKVINIDGHDFRKLVKALNTTNDQRRKPTVIIADTVKGSCVQCMENSPNYHGKAPNDKEYIIALFELLNTLLELDLKNITKHRKDTLKTLIDITEKHLKAIKFYCKSCTIENKEDMKKLLKVTKIHLESPQNNCDYCKQIKKIDMSKLHSLRTKL